MSAIKSKNGFDRWPLNFSYCAGFQGLGTALLLRYCKPEGRRAELVARRGSGVELARVDPREALPSRQHGANGVNLVRAGRVALKLRDHGPTPRLRDFEVVTARER